MALTVAAEFHELRSVGQREVRFNRHALRRRKARLDCLVPVLFDRQGTEITLVEPAAALFGQDAGNAFAVQIGPLVLTRLVINRLLGKKLPPFRYFFLLKNRE